MAALFLCSVICDSFKFEAIVSVLRIISIIKINNSIKSNHEMNFTSLVIISEDLRVHGTLFFL